MKQQKPLQWLLAIATTGDTLKDGSKSWLREMIYLAGFVFTFTGGAEDQAKGPTAFGKKRKKTSITPITTWFA
jgi:hypothetical protein